MKIHQGTVFLPQTTYNEIDLDRDYVKFKSSPTETIYVMKEKLDDHKYHIWRHIAVVSKANPSFVTLIPITEPTKNLLLNPGIFRKCNQKMR